MKEAVTLIEVVLAIVILGMVLTAFFNMFAEVMRKLTYQQVSAEVVWYAQELMELVKTKRFDENFSPPWSPSEKLGVDEGEDPNDRTTFDDVDDFINTTDQWVICPATGYIRSVKVDYVVLDTSSEPPSWVSCGEINCAEVSNCSQPQECCYKRITIYTTYNGTVPVNFKLVTIVAGS